MIPQAISKAETFSSLTQDGKLNHDLARSLTEMLHQGKTPIDTIDELLVDAEGFEGSFADLIQHTTQRLSSQN